MDTVSKKDRSAIMAKIKSRGSKIEVDFGKALCNAGFRYRKNVSKYFGKPDFVLKKHKTVIFIDSCFWHGCRWHGSMPASNKKFWENKIAKNKARDKAVNHEYKKNGWQILRFWEHGLNKKNGEAIHKIMSLLNK